MRRKTVLIVEDTVVWHRLLKRCLESSGYAVHIAATCEEGLSQYRTIEPDCILLDFHLPDGDAVSFCSALKGLTAGKVPPVIIFSGDADIERVAYLECGADKFILKDTIPSCIIETYSVA